MFQPFEKFQANYINRLIELKKVYLVSQTYTRVRDLFSEEDKTDILVSDYDDIGLAKIHLNAVSHDKYASIINLTNEEHMKKLNQMLDPDSKYVIYWSVVKDLKKMEEAINSKYTENMRRYLQYQTNLKIGRGETLIPLFQVVFGELFIILKRGSQTLRIKFEEIERA